MYTGTKLPSRPKIKVRDQNVSTAKNELTGVRLRFQLLRKWSLRWPPNSAQHSSALQSLSLGRNLGMLLVLGLDRELCGRKQPGRHSAQTNTQQGEPGTKRSLQRCHTMKAGPRLKDLPSVSLGKHARTFQALKGAQTPYLSFATLP